MPLSLRLKRLLLIRESEWALVTRMFAFEFFQGASIALFFTSAISLFLEHFYSTFKELPKVFILSAFLLWFFGWLYAKLEHILTVKQITLGVLLFNAVSILTFRLVAYSEEPALFYYLMLAWFNVVYLLNNLEFWGLASRLFDVRQSKRLFSIISAGDIPAKFIGYMSAVVIVERTGPYDLLWIAVAFSLISLLFFHRLISLDAFQIELKVSQASHSTHHNPKPRDLYNLISGNKLIRQVALISFFTLCTYTIVNYVFYGYIKVKFKTDESLAFFIAWFFAASRAFTLVIKLFLTNRIADRLGVKGALLITPVLLTALCILSLIPGLLSGEYATFYWFGMMAIAIDVLRSAIQSPVLLSTMQPLSLHQRLQGHTIMKGVMDPFAYFVVGVLLYTLNQYYTQIDFRILSGVTLLMLTFWIVWIFSADRNYIHTLTQAIRNRLLNEREIEITDQESLKVLKEKIRSPEEGEAVFVLHLLESQPIPDKGELILSALSHPGLAVRKEAVKLLGTLPDEERDKCISYILDNEEEDTVKAEALRHISKDDDSDISILLASPDVVISSSAIAQIVSTAQHPLRDEALKRLNMLSNSDNTRDRKYAAQAMGIAGDKSLEPLLDSLLNDADNEVCLVAFQTAFTLQHPRITDFLLKLFNDRDKTFLFEVLEQSGELALPAILNYIRNNKDSLMLNKLIHIMGRTGKTSHPHLLKLMDTFPQRHEIIFRSLHQSGFIPDDKQLPALENLGKGYLNAAAQIAFSIHYLQIKEEDALVVDALYLELYSVRDKILELFTLLYDSEKMQRAKLGLKLNTRESLPNALELIDLLVAKKYSHPFISIYEHSNMKDTCHHLKETYDEPYLSLDSVRNDILFDKSHYYYAWTKACVLYSVAKSGSFTDPEVIEPLTYSGNDLIRESATFALENQRTNRLNERTD